VKNAGALQEAALQVVAASRADSKLDPIRDSTDGRSGRLEATEQDHDDKERSNIT
jgi:hypothetical protein